MKVNFEEVLQDITKLGTKVTTDKYQKQGDYPIIDQGQKFIAGYLNGHEGLLEDIPVIIFGDHTRILKYVDFPFFLGADGVKVLKVKNTNFLSKYVYYNLCATAIPNTGYNRHFKWLKQANLKAIPLEAQQKIINSLDEITALIDKHKQQLEKLDLLVKSKFIEMFGDSEFNTKGFTLLKLSDLCTVGSSKRIYQTEQSKEGVPFLRISDLNNRIDGIEDTCELYIPEETYKSFALEGLIPNKGDILITARGTLGRCYIVKESDKFYFQDGMITWLSSLSNKVNSLYISYLFSTEGIKKQIESLQAGSTVAYLSIAMTKKLNIMLPPIELQNEFASFVEQTDKVKSKIKQSLEKFDILKKALMQKYFG